MSTKKVMFILITAFVLIHHCQSETVTTSSRIANLVGELMPNNGVLVNLAKISWIREDKVVEQWNNLAGVPLSTRPKDGRMIVIVMDGADTLDPDSSARIKELAKGFTRAHLILLNATRMNLPGLELINKIFLIPKQKEIVIKVMKPGESLKTATKPVEALLTERAMVKDVGVKLPLKAFIIGGFPAIVSNSLTDPSGYRIDLYNVLAQYMGFKIDWKIEANYNQLAKIISNDTLSVGVFLGTWPRTEMIDGYPTLTFIQFHYISGKRRALLDYMTVLHPFDWHTWVLSVTFIVTFCLLFYLAHRLRWRSRCSDVSGIFVQNLSICLEQNNNSFHDPCYWKGNTKRLIFLSVFVYVMVVTKGYKTSLKSQLIALPLEKKIDSTQDVIESDKEVFILSSTAARRSMLNSPDPQVQEVVQKATTYDVEPLNLINRAMANEILIVEKAMWARPYGLTISREIVYSGGQSYIVAKDWPWPEQLTDFSLRLTAAGITNKMVQDQSQGQERAANTSSPATSTSDHEQVVLALTHVQTPFLFLAVGWTIALIIFVVEMWLFDYFLYHSTESLSKSIEMRSV